MNELFVNQVIWRCVCLRAGASVRQIYCIFREFHTGGRFLAGRALRGARAGTSAVGCSSAARPRPGLSLSGDGRAERRRQLRLQLGFHGHRYQWHVLAFPRDVPQSQRRVQPCLRFSVALPLGINGEEAALAMRKHRPSCRGHPAAARAGQFYPGQSSTRAPRLNGEIVKMCWHVLTRFPKGAREKKAPPRASAMVPRACWAISEATAIAGLLRSVKSMLLIFISA